MPAFDVARRWKGRVVLGRTGGKLGSVLDVYYDAENDEPGWVLLGAAGADGGARLVPVRAGRPGRSWLARTPACGS
jgi:hypothetical protein